MKTLLTFSRSALSPFLSRKVSSIISLLTVALSLSAAELVTLSPENYDAYAPQGDTAGAFFGDYVMHNDHLSICIADPFLLSGRSASRWAISKVGGAVIALTPRHNLSSATPTAYYPGPARYKPDAPAFRDEFDAEAANPPWSRPERAPVNASEVTLNIGTYEIASGKSLAELAALPAHLQGAPKPAVTVIYKLLDNEPFVRVSVTYTNPTTTVFVHTPTSILRTDGDWEHGLDPDKKLFWTYHRPTHATTVVMADDHTLSLQRPGPQSHLRQIQPNGSATITLPPGGSHTFNTHLFPASSLFAAREIALKLQNLPLRHVKATTRVGNNTDTPVEIIARIANQIFGAGLATNGTLDLYLPEQTDLKIFASTPGLHVFGRHLAANDSNEISFNLPPVATLKTIVTDQYNNPIPHKLLLYRTTESAIKITPGSPAASQPPIARWGGVDGITTTALEPGSYYSICSAGSEYDIAEQEHEITPGSTTTLKITLNRSLTTHGWISAITHNHTARSGASELYYVYPYSPNSTTDGGSVEPIADKIASLAAEHIRFAPATEHNFSYTYADKIAELGLTNHLATCPGLGLTAGRRHTVTHQNVFPVPYIKGAQDGGAKQREEHIGQLEWLVKWDDHTSRVVQIVVPRNDPLRISPNMDILDVVALEPLVEGKPLSAYDNRILNWVDQLTLGYRLPAVCNAGRFSSFQETGRYRNYIRSNATSTADIDPVAIAAAMRRGEVMMTTGPYLESTVIAATTGQTITSIKDTLHAPKGEIIVKVRVQCSNWTACDRVQILANGIPATECNRIANPELFDLPKDSLPDIPHATFYAPIPLKLTADSHIIVVASGMGRDLHSKTGNPSATRLHVAVSNPVFVDIDGNGYSVVSPLDDKVRPFINFIEPPVAAPGYAPGRIRVNLLNDSKTTAAADTIELLTRPAGAIKLLTPATQSYQIAPGSETWLEWLITFEDDFLKKNYPIRSNYNLATTFGLYLKRSPVAPGRKAANMWMFIDHPIPSLPPLSNPDLLAATLADERPMPFAIRNQRFGHLRCGISGRNLALHATITDKNRQRRATIIDGSCLEIYGANSGRDATGAAAVPGGYYAVKQVYLVPPLNDQPAEFFKRLGTGAEIEPAPEIKATFKDTNNGYEVSALIPLNFLGIDIDRIPRTHHVWQSGQADAELVGKYAFAGRFLFEARANIPGTAGATTHATVFGSPAPHVDTSAFGTMRLAGPILCQVTIENELPVDPDQPPAQVRLTLTNTTNRTLSDIVTLTATPPEAATISADGTLSYTLLPGQTISRTFSVTPTSTTPGTPIHLVVPRSPQGQVAATPSPRLPFSHRPIQNIGACHLANLTSKLTTTRSYTARNGDNQVAQVYLALANDHLAITATVVEPQIRQTPSVWKGSDIEIFGSLPGGNTDDIGQIFLVPGTADLPPKALRKIGPDITAAPEIKITSSTTANGYQLTALVPLDHLKLQTHSGQLAIEVQISSLINGKQSYTTLFGSVRAYLDTSRYGLFQTQPLPPANQP
ncbi:MAG: hypothetical protein GX230_00040 [Lentisphaerae bacterium]|nr:hypothetical protein [Lentisphaerota bacterium]